MPRSRPSGRVVVCILLRGVATLWLGVLAARLFFYSLAYLNQKGECPMKTRLLIAALIVCFESAHPQGNVGVGDAGLSGPYIPPPSPEVLAQEQWQIRVASVPPDHAVFRSVNGHIFNILYAQTWRVVAGQVYQMENNILILQTDWRQIGVPQMTYYAITNYPGNPTANTTINVLAMRVGNYDMFGTPIEFYDCGFPSSPPPLTPEQIKVAQDAAKLAASSEARKEFIAQSNAVLWLQSQASNGDAGAQCSLGEHYLNGQGCQTNRQQGVYWLTQAAAQGDIEASNKLANLQK